VQRGMGKRIFKNMKILRKLLNNTKNKNTNYFVLFNLQTALFAAIISQMIMMKSKNRTSMKSAKITKNRISSVKSGKELKNL
jgi:hypothetical protein